MKSVVVNKLNLGEKTVGYRFDIIDEGSRIVSLDITKSSGKALLGMVDKSDVKKRGISYMVRL